ncbi:hypothetical protein [Fictibacillus phosphorivorans]|uniref:hypothetical protein n=1 Tax=Fictibacillus phosphorivorans TaxID=1221500 RepID=UPI00203AF153|nr:hypothetical protein [Fictibacillus phosphorivorans]MCM3718163.1 hypothetical protein [Fictibacillus phosphorivorans]MCM3775790.1 hypothetical protein [Fictibacillus phosphorivorans]
MKEYSFPVDVEFKTISETRPLAGGVYRPTNNKITLYIKGLENQCLTLYKSLKPFEIHAAIVFAHELGHALDDTLLDICEQLDTIKAGHIKRRIEIRAETNAWEIARILLGDRLKVMENRELFELLMHHSLEPYYGKGFAA